MGRITRKLRIIRVFSPPGGDIVVGGRADAVAVEEPLEIRVAGRSLTTTMRTPGNDVELVHGFLFSEGLIRSGADISAVRYCGGTCGQDENSYNVVDVDLAPGVPVPGPAAQRAFTTTSACGVCGTTSIDQLMGKRRVPITPVRIDPSVALSLPGRLREHQVAFERTGGIHAAGIFTPSGEAVEIREDVGRHNAADKAIGALLMTGRVPLGAPAILALSGRASFELVQKAVMAGIGAVVAVSAASSLAIDTAEEAGIFLAGFLREGRMNVYTGAGALIR